MNGKDMELLDKVHKDFLKELCITCCNCGDCIISDFSGGRCDCSPIARLGLHISFVSERGFSYEYNVDEAELAILQLVALKHGYFFISAEEGVLSFYKLDAVSWHNFIIGETELTRETLADAVLLLHICRQNNINCCGYDATDYSARPYWYIECDALTVTCYAMDGKDVCSADTVKNFVLEHIK